jgi:hypothetical protein
VENDDDDDDDEEEEKEEDDAPPAKPVELTELLGEIMGWLAEAKSWYNAVRGEMLQLMKVDHMGHHHQERRRTSIKI